nr:MAG TPA: hypothetical protein [Caudoviricetes sp.]DAM88133.1 MAG TPA: hypothetical protein [Caudoviricetes sp.]
MNRLPAGGRGWDAAGVCKSEDQGRPRAGGNDCVAERARLGAGANGADRIL